MALHGPVLEMILLLDAQASTTGLWVEADSGRRGRVL